MILFPACVCGSNVSFVILYFQCCWRSVKEAARSTTIATWAPFARWASVGVRTDTALNTKVARNSAERTKVGPLQYRYFLNATCGVRVYNVWFVSKGSRKITYLNKLAISFVRVCIQSTLY